ncbi:MAG: DUF4265 domain-containing protein [Bacteroidia bacterium]|nr:DUF4265 domain-containing protein [Bacteroidia bacterium]
MTATKKRAIIDMDNATKIYFSIADSFLDDGQIESIWAIPLEGNLFQIDNIPFYAKNISYGDIVLCDEIDNRQLFKSIVHESGNSTIRVVAYNESRVKEYRDAFRVLGCDSELSDLENLFSLNVPVRIDYKTIWIILEEGLKGDLWDYEEGCISAKHSIDLGI